MLDQLLHACGDVHISVGALRNVATEITTQHLDDLAALKALPHIITHVLERQQDGFNAALTASTHLQCELKEQLSMLNVRFRDELNKSKVCATENQVLRMREEDLQRCIGELTELRDRLLNRNIQLEEEAMRHQDLIERLSTELRGLKMIQ